MIHRPLGKWLWYDLIKNSALLASSLMFRVRITGRENIPKEGPVIVAANHQSTLDPPLIGAACPRRMNYMARATLYRFDPFGALIRSLDAIPIDQEGSPLAGLREALRRLKEGEGLVIFPEGSRTWHGRIGPFQAGFTILARKSEAAIVPAAIEGAYDVWPRWQALPRFGPVHVHYGPAIPHEEIRKLKADELAQLVERRIREHHAELCRRAIFASRARRPIPPTPEPSK